MSTKETKNLQENRKWFFIVLVPVLIFSSILFPALGLGTTLTVGKENNIAGRRLTSRWSSLIVAEEASNHAWPTMHRNGSRDDASPKRASLRTTSNSGSSGTREESRRKLPGGYPDFKDPAIGGSVLFVIVLLFLCCCCRGMLSDLLACVCLYEICCDDGAVAGFDLMPL